MRNYLIRNNKFRLNPETLCWVFFVTKTGIIDECLTTKFLIFCQEFFIHDLVDVESLKQTESYKCCMDDMFISNFLTDDLIQQMIDFELD